MNLKPEKIMENQDAQEFEHDVMMIDRVEKYFISDNQYAALKHLFEKAAPEKKEDLVRNYVSVLIGSAVMDYENIYVRKRTDIKVWRP